MLVLFAGLVQAQDGLIPKRQRLTRDTLLGGLRPERTAFKVNHYALDVHPRTDSVWLSGSNTITLTVKRTARRIQLDLHPRLIIDSILLNGERLLIDSTHLQRIENSFFLNFDKELQAGKQYKLSIHYAGRPLLAPMAPWSGGLVWAKDDRGFPFLGMACQGEGANLWYPCVDHPTAKPDSASLSITVRKQLVGVGNGRLRGIDTLSNRLLRYNWAVVNPIAPYNLSFYVGNYVHFGDTLQQANGQRLDLDYWVLQDELLPARKHFEQVKPMLRIYEKLFGPYPFPEDGYKLVSAPYWGMEHQSAVAYGNKFLNNQFGFDFIIIHESGHEYWGNSVSYIDKAEMYVHESYCTYAERLFLEEWAGEQTADLYFQNQRLQIANSMPVIRLYGRNQEAGDNDQYYKGAWVLHTLRQQFDSDSAFKAALKHVYQKFKGKIAPSDSLEAAWSQLIGYDLQPFWEVYLRRAKLPLLQVRKRGETLEARFTRAVPGFSLIVPFINADGQVQRVRVSNTWVGTGLKPGSVPDLRQVLVGG